MKNLLLTSLCLVMLGCAQAPVKIKQQNQSGQANQQDSIKTPSPTPKEFARYAQQQYEYDAKEYSAKIKSIYFFPDTLKYDSSYYCEGVYLFVTRKKNGSTDSIMIEDGDHPRFEFKNVTEAFHSKTPVFLFASEGDSDQWTTSYVSYKNDSLKDLIDIIDAGGIVELQWKDEHTMVGSASIRDELVGYGEDCPIRVSLDDYSIYYDTVLLRSYGLTVKTLSTFKGYRLMPNETKTQYKVKKGTEIWIDSINRINRTVTLKIKDTIIVYVPISEIQDKIPVNAAG